MPKGVVEATDQGTGFWWRWARFVTKRPIPVAAAGLADRRAASLIPALHLNPSEAQIEGPARGRATRSPVARRSPPPASRSA